MSELALSIDEFHRRYMVPAIERMAAMLRRELRRRRISRRAFLQMSRDEQSSLMLDAVRRYTNAD